METRLAEHLSSIRHWPTRVTERCFYLNAETDVTVRVNLSVDVNVFRGYIFCV